MSIEDVIARSRQPGAFVERKRFAVERANAVRKMRQFALADPHYYVLELIQASVANGALSINFMVDRTSCTFSYVGGGFNEDELIKLFDFLFAAQSDMAYSALRQLALGVNALMLMSPEQIIIESGDGTIEGTTRVVIMPGKDLVDVGTPEKALQGTFIRASGLDRSLIAAKSNLQATEYGPPETQAIEDRCLTLPIPIIVNDHSVFGYSSVRTPTIFGYSKVISIDEGDLYGSIGLMETGANNPGFKLLTYGTWVQTVDRALLSGSQFGGVISCDRLNKTADHAAIVRDMRYEELWARLQPYARQLVYGKVVAGKYEVKTFEGRPVSTKQLNDILAQCDYAVLMQADLSPRSPEALRAVRIAKGLGDDVPVLRVQEDDVLRVRYMSRRARVLMPGLTDGRDEEFLTKPLIDPPPTPWLMEPIKGAVITAAELLLGIWKKFYAGEELDRTSAQVMSDKLNARWVNLNTDKEGKVDVSPLVSAVDGVEDGQRHMLNEHAAVLGALNASVYAPVYAFAQEDECLVRLVSMGRLLWAGRVKSPFPGFVVVMEMDGLMPRHLSPVRFEHNSELDKYEQPEGESFARWIAEIAVESLVTQMEEATERLLDNLQAEDIKPDSSAAQVCLGLLARESHLRFKMQEGTPHFELLMMRPHVLKLTSLPLFKNLDGETLALREILAWMPSQGGLVYGVVDGDFADLQGVNRSRVLDLTPAQESILIALIGESAYVRVDGRDTLAILTSPMIIQVRDLLMGDVVQDEQMRQYEQHDLLISQNVELTPAQEKTLISSLLQLMKSPSSSDFNEDDMRRQALRHLQRFVCRRFFARGELHGLESEPLFVDLYGQPINMIEFAKLLRGSPDGKPVVYMGDGRAIDVLDPVHTSFATTRSDMDESTRCELAMNPYLACCLAPHVALMPAFGFELELEMSEDDLSSLRFLSEHYLISHEIGENELMVTGRIGIALKPSTMPALIWRDSASGRCVSAAAATLDFNIVGVLEGKELDLEGVERLLFKHSSEMIEQLLEQLPSYEYGTDRWRRAVDVLLTWAGGFLSLQHEPGLGVHYLVMHPLARRILHLPLFDTVAHQPLHATALVRSFCALANGQENVGQVMDMLAANLDDVLRGWLERTLVLDHVRRSRTGRMSSVNVEDHGERTMLLQSEWLHDLKYTIRYYLHDLRPDTGHVTHIEVLSLAVLEDMGHMQHYASEFRRWRLKECQKTPFLLLKSRTTELLIVDDTHWLFERIAAAYQEGKRTQVSEFIAWALLAIYAHLNALLEPVTNLHEQQFQIAVMRALLHHKLELKSWAAQNGEAQ